ncbi:hypothetical protein EV702DRAFT_1125887 [Suillus placidus]|uniref:Uncharacterized protein n=1 Tax=Suillus placidus TaxID=48579 RepID=A0A9P6ZR25_9AGAM|nr:hypothetical protein EV702DRAFT_1125887 [Suillus placidus]
MQSWRTVNGPLYTVLVKHNIFYYACGLFLAAVNALMAILFSQSAYHSVFEDFQLSIHAILATRMYLHLWYIDQHMHDSAVVLISMSDMLPTDGTA